MLRIWWISRVSFPEHKINLLLQIVQTITDAPFPDICLFSDAMPAGCLNGKCASA
jgi:hypothetical protein